MSIIITIHPDDIPPDLRMRVKGGVDVYLKLGSTNIGGKDVKTLKIVKLIGAKENTDSGFAFDVDMTFGIKIVPISMANA